MRGALNAALQARALMDTSMPWQVDNRALDDLIKPHGWKTHGGRRLSACLRLI